MISLIKAGLLCLALTLCAMEGKAADLLLSWSDAKITATRVGGEPITGSVDYVIRYTLDNVEQPLIVTQVDALSHTISDIQAGTYAFQISTREDGLQGEYSAVIVRQVSLEEVMAPNSVTLTLELTNCDGCGLELK